ncbi:hypothetical protein NMG60_11025101 [Bertholletia excelsa]
MAGMARGATSTSFFVSFVNTIPSRRRTVLVLSSTPKRRKNYLRRKLIKVPTKPYPTPLTPESPPTTPAIPIECPREEQADNPSGQLAGEELEESGTRELEVETSEAAGILNGVNFSTGSVVKFGFYLLGAFVFQTVCAVWVFGSASSDSLSEDKTRVLDLGADGNNGAILRLSKQGRILYEDEPELEKRIVEIQAMARDARDRERLESRANNLGDDEIVKTGIEKEVEGKLVKLRKRLQNQLEKSPTLPVSYSRKDDKVEGDNLDKKDANNVLMFKKKYKFRSPSGELIDKPKGFQGLEDPRIISNSNSDSAIEDEATRNQTVDSESLNFSGNLQDSVSKSLVEDGRKEGFKSFQTRKKLRKTGANAKLGKENRAAKPRGFGVSQETSGGRPLVKTGKPGQSRMIDSQRYQSMKKDTSDSLSNEPDTWMGDGSLRSRRIGDKQTPGKVKGKHSKDKDDFWWLSLPYVLAIFMRRGENGEGPEGLFTLKSTHSTMDEDDMSRIVAFEDRGDATNFCYLLHSFFEDLGDFSAEIVPMSIEEVSKAVRSDSMNIIVVKKGQIKLYAGQPLPEVEMALHALVKCS